jgi:hypothetical protein
MNTVLTDIKITLKPKSVCKKPKSCVRPAKQCRGQIDNMTQKNHFSLDFTEGIFAVYQTLKQHMFWRARGQVNTCMHSGHTRKIFLSYLKVCLVNHHTDTDGITPLMGTQILEINTTAGITLHTHT